MLAEHCLNQFFFSGPMIAWNRLWYFSYLLGDTPCRRNQIFLTRSTILRGTVSSSIIGRAAMMTSDIGRSAWTGKDNMVCNWVSIFVGQVVRWRRAEILRSLIIFRIRNTVNCFIFVSINFRQIAKKYLFCQFCKFVIWSLAEYKIVTRDLNIKCF